MEEKIDLVLLWSIMPETFSYTLYESMAAGCFVITHKNSGNIAITIKQNNKGEIIDNEADLIALLTQNHDDLFRVILDFQDQNRNYHVLEANIVVQKEIVKAK